MKPTKQSFVIDTPYTRIRVLTCENALCGIDFVSSRVSLKPPANLFQREVARQIKQYFRDPEFHFDLPLDVQGTPHQLKVWRAMSRIPAGHTASYGKLAAKIHSSARAVGNACRHNPVPLIQPCHRVIGANGPGGFAGQRTGAKLDLKLALLAHEGVID
jgi:methylated-DNA-[protein]-cysteine S-methyltransferase